MGARSRQWMAPGHGIDGGPALDSGRLLATGEISGDCILAFTSWGEKRFWTLLTIGVGDG